MKEKILLVDDESSIRESLIKVLHAENYEVVAAENGQDAIEYKRVQLGPLMDGLRVIRGGLASNDWVVVNGLMSIRPGVKVKAGRAPALAAQPPPVSTAQN